jgi:hypothetical protein
VYGENVIIFRNREYQFYGKGNQGFPLKPILPDGTENKRK